MARFRTLALLFPMVLLLGCAETRSDRSDLASYQTTSWAWKMTGPLSAEVTQTNGSSTQAAASDTRRSNVTAGAVVAILLLIALLIISDDTSACSGSGCGGGGGGISIN